MSDSEDFLYARVDAVDISRKLHLVKLELIESYLFFELDDQAVYRFFSSLKKLIIGDNFYGEPLLR